MGGKPQRKIPPGRGLKAEPSYQSRAVRVEHGQAAVDRLVLLHVLFEGQALDQSRYNLGEEAKHLVLKLLNQ